MEVASAFAEEWARRRTVHQVLLSWKAKADELRSIREEEEAKLAKEEQERQERWGRLMKTFDGKRPTSNSPSKWKGKEKEVEADGVLRPQPVTVEEMRRVVSDTARARERMWEAGVFMDSVMRKAMSTSGRSKVELIPDDWGVWLAGKKGPTWRWLRVKFGLEPGDDGDDGVDDILMLPLVEGHDKVCVCSKRCTIG